MTIIKTQTIFRPFPELETSNLRLKEITAQDAPEIFEIFSDAEITRFLDVVPFRNFEEAGDLVDFFAERATHERGIRWGITYKNNPQLVGTCGFNLWTKDEESGEIGYDLLKPYWRRGIMTEALKAVLQFGFETMALRRIEAYVLLDNLASERLLQSLGFRWECRVREFQVSRGDFSHLTRFVMERGRWQSTMRLANLF
jgi:ribosomal-protein-alanine N-acetyltransferase